MRDYTRKAKRVDNGEWIIGYLVSCDERYFISEVPECDTCKYMYEGYWFGTFYEVDPDTICNPTGLTDKNGNKIWENDIVSCGGYLVVTWKEEFASFCLSKKGWMYQHFFGEAVNGCDCKVIGNIFDNADLLKGE